MAEFSRWLGDKGVDWPENLWAGTSVTKQGTLTRIRPLLDVGNQHTMRFLSIEPQLEPIDYGDALCDVDWAIHGGSSGKDVVTFEVEWATSLLEGMPRP